MKPLATALLVRAWLFVTAPPGMLTLLLAQLLEPGAWATGFFWTVNCEIVFLRYSVVLWLTPNDHELRELVDAIGGRS